MELRLRVKGALCSFREKKKSNSEIFTSCFSGENKVPVIRTLFVARKVNKVMNKAQGMKLFCPLRTVISMFILFV